MPALQLAMCGGSGQQQRSAHPPPTTTTTSAAATPRESCPRDAASRDAPSRDAFVEDAGAVDGIGTPGGVPCSERLRWELRPSYPMFSLEEPPLPLPPPAPHLGPSPPSSSPRSAHRYIDLSRSFAPRRPLLRRLDATPLIRLALLTWSIQVLAYDVRHYPPHNLYIYMAYLTHWGHVLGILYLMCGFLCSVRPQCLRQPQPQHRPHPQQPRQQPQSNGGTPHTPDTPADHHLAAEEEPKLHPLPRLTWCLYSTVAPLQIGITLLYWSAIVVEPPNYVSVMEHGGIMAMVLFDGLYVGLVPVRAKHVVYLLGVCTAYVLWSVLDYVAGIGNGEWGPAYEDDALYPILNWGDEVKGPLVVSGFAVLVLCPGLFGLVWAMSLVSRRRATGSDWAEEDEEEVRKSSSACCCRCGSPCQCSCCGHGWLSCDGSRRPLYRGPADAAAASSGSGCAEVAPGGRDAFEYDALDGPVMA